MNLFLTSQAYEVLDLFPKTFDLNPTELSLAFIANAADNYTSKDWLFADRDKLVELGFKVTDLDLRQFNQESLAVELEKYQVVFVAGGNTFYLLNTMRQAGFDKLIANFLNTEGRYYIGSSAGSLVVAPSIEGVDLLDDPAESPELTDFTGFNLVNFVPLVHWGSEHFEQQYTQQLLKNYRLTTPFITITDHQAIIVKKSKLEVVNI
jgi:dipeptidase E